MTLAVILKDWQAIIILILTLTGAMFLIYAIARITIKLIEISIYYNKYKEFYFKNNIDNIKKHYDAKLQDLKELEEYIERRAENE